MNIFNLNKNFGYKNCSLQPLTTTFLQRSTQILKIPEIVFINDERKMNLE